MNHVFRKYTSPEVWLSFSYLQFDADTAVWFFTFAGAVTGDNAIALNPVAQPPNKRRIDRPKGYTGKRKEVVKPIAEQNSDDGLRKTALPKKTWMMRVPHLISPMLICL